MAAQSQWCGTMMTGHHNAATTAQVWQPNDSALQQRYGSTEHMQNERTPCNSLSASRVYIFTIYN